MGMGVNAGSAAVQRRSSQVAQRRHTSVWVGTVSKKRSDAKAGARDVLGRGWV